MEKLNNSNFSGKISFLVKSNQFRESAIKAHHITPVLIEKKPGENMKIFIMDSVVHAKDSTGPIIQGRHNTGYETRQSIYDNAPAWVNAEHSTQIIYNQLVKSEINKEENSEIQNPATIYLSGARRQIDFVSCPLFSLDDVKQFFEIEDFFDQLEANGDLQKLEVLPESHQENEDPHVRCVTNLQPMSMNLAQLIENINKYIEKNENEGLFKISEGKKTLPHSLQKSARALGKDKIINMKAADRYAKYLKLIDHYIKNVPLE